MVNNIGCLVVQYFRIGETKGFLINLIVKLTSVTASNARRKSKVIHALILLGFMAVMK